VVIDHLQEVTTICILHYNAETHVLEEGLLVADNIRVIYRGQNSDLVKRVILLFARKFAHLYFFHSIDGTVRLPLDLEHFAKASLTEFFLNDEVSHLRV